MLNGQQQFKKFFVINFYPNHHQTDLHSHQKKIDGVHLAQGDVMLHKTVSFIILLSANGYFYLVYNTEIRYYE